MREFQDSIQIETSPERIWEWLSGLAGRYREWHPGHESAVWVRGEPNQVGSVLRAVESIDGHTETLRFELTSVEAPRRFEYRILGVHGLLLPGGGFKIDARDGESVFTASISYRGGWLTERLLRGRVAALRRHMREEGQNLKRLLESD